MSYLESVKVHPVRRQNFRDTLAQKCNPYLIRQGLRCCTIPSLICQQKSYASQDAVKVLQDSPFYP